jgi:nucleotide-binding universal stress UspA family protein
LAIELARASQSSIEALYVSDKPRRSWTDPVSMTMGLEEEAALKDVVALAEQQGVRVRTSVNRSGNPVAAVLRSARRHDLIVLGVSRRPGDRLFFGQVAAEIINDAPCSVVIVSS